MDTAQTASRIGTGSAFPEFQLQNQHGDLVSKVDIIGAKSIVYFYPKDDTSGCTLEACDIRDNLPRFEGVRVLGVSPDGVRSHKKFAEKYSLNFDLLADERRELIDALGLWVEKSLYGKKYMGVERSTFLLDEQGRILRVWYKVKPEGHALEILTALSA